MTTALDRCLRIAQVAPLYESVPPLGYGGTERVVSYLTEELVAMGHEVTLFASGDSKTSAWLIPCCPTSLRQSDCVDPLALHLVMLESVYRRAHEFDVVHFHVDYLHYPATRHQPFKHVTTLHGRLDLRDLVPLYAEFAEVPLVSISRAQRRPLPPSHWVGNVPHGLPLSLFELGFGGETLAFVGRVSPEKGLDRAIDIAERTGLQLRIGAKVDRADREYHERVIAPLLAAKPHVCFLGEIGHIQKQELLGRARALLFPIDWPEPFGLVMLEAMACGTPVIAFDFGSVREVVDDGVTGFIVDSVADAVEAVDRARHLSRAAVRERFEQRFSAERMARDYVEVYLRLLSEDARHRAREPGLPHPGHELTRG
jgi:glycosyltransferase involved in cell wall biosynthesis